MDTNTESVLGVDSSHAKAVKPFNKDDIIIAVMGVTGAGKSTLIKQLIGEASTLVPVVGHRLSSETKLMDVYQFHHQVHGTIHLIDTPGFDDTHDSDAEVLLAIAFFLSSIYEKKVKLAGIIYLHRISDNRMSGSALRNLRMFKELCGEDAYKHIVLATSMWGKEEKETALRRERELVDSRGFWSKMQQRGSAVKRWHGDSNTAHDIVDHLLRARFRHGVVALKIQREMVDEGKTLVNTSAGQEVNRELSELKDKMERELRRIEEESKEAMSSRDLEWQEALAEQRLQSEKTRLMAEKSEEALKVDLERLLAETTAKYQNQIDRMFEELQKKEDERRHVHELSEEKDRAVKALEAKIFSSETVQEQEELRERMMREKAELEAARLEEERLSREIEAKKDRWNKIVLWMKKTGKQVLPVLRAVVAAGVGGVISGVLQASL